jgi:hypothetical protein
VFGASGLVLLRGHGEPWEIESLPPMGALSAFARVELRTAGADVATAREVRQSDVVRVPLRVAPSTRPLRRVTATWIDPAHVPLLRRLAYALPQATLAQARVAMTARGAFLRLAAGIEAIPLGTFFVEVHPNLYLPAGHEVIPAVAPEVLARALGAPASKVLFIGTDARAVAVDDGAFVPLEMSLLKAPAWEPAVAEALDAALDEAPIDLSVGSIGLMPLQGLRSASEEGKKGTRGGGKKRIVEGE